VGLDAGQARLVKFTNNAVIVLPRARAVLRIAGSPGTRQRIPAVIAAARWFASHGIPAVRLWPTLEHPISVGPHLVTVWEHVPDGATPPQPSDLAAILRAIHALPAPNDLPQWRTAESLRQRLAHADGVDPDVAAYLTDELANIQASLDQLPAIPPLIPPGVIHGDAHLGNLIPSPTGPVICDFDSTSTGPREWDLVPAAVGSLRFNYPTDVHQGIVDAYGLDVTAWPGFPTLRRLREFQLVTSVLPVLNANPALRPQWQHRLNTYRSRDYDSRWTPYADVTT
jgi:hypothetical protein